MIRVEVCAIASLQRAIAHTSGTYPNRNLPLHCQVQIRTPSLQSALR
ncbi:MAG: hypothetical protein KME13_05740 [Myxacorys californica WJT36-NPBG1]|nr:hypothetical protein [Myxacorys californica WJT36-NPBG1]